MTEFLFCLFPILRGYLYDNIRSWFTDEALLLFDIFFKNCYNHTYKEVIKLPIEAWSVIISGIALVAAVFSPVITAIVNNKYQSKINRQKYFDEHRAQVIENYIQSVGELCEDVDRESFRRAYGKNSKEIYLYIPESLWEKIDKIDESIYQRHHRDACILLTELCKELNKYPPRLVKNSRNKQNK